MTDAPITGETSDGYHTFNELYHYRMLYNALLFNEWAAQGKHDVHKSYFHSDGSQMGGWFVVYATLPTGQISNHYADDYWDLFRVPERERGVEWDGHTPQQAVERMEAWISQRPGPDFPEIEGTTVRIIH